MLLRSVRPGVHAASLVFVLGLVAGAAVSGSQEPDAQNSLYRPQRVISFEHVRQELVLKCDVGMLVIRPIADNIAHVRYFPTLKRAASPAAAIGAAPPLPKYRAESTPGAIRLVLSQLTVSVDRRTAQLTFLDAKQNILLASRLCQLSRRPGAEGPDFNIHAEFLAPTDEAYYALGQYEDESLNQRGRTVSQWQDFQDPDGRPATMPFLVTNRKYGFAFDNASKTTVTPGKAGLTTWDAEAGDALSYYVIYGNTADDIYRGYRSLAGRPPLPSGSADIGGSGPCAGGAGPEGAVHAELHAGAPDGNCHMRQDS